MTKIESQPALQEIKHDVVNQDFTKARLVIDHFPELGVTEQKAILLELSGAADAFAIPVLSYLLIKHPKTAARFPTITDTILSKAVHSPNIVIHGLAGEGLEKFHYLKLAGELNLQEAVPNLISLMLGLEEKPALLTVLTSLGTLGNPEAVNAVSEFLYVEDFDLLVAAVTALGRIASSTALQRLAEFLGKDPKIDHLILHVFAEVQDDFSLRKLNKTLQARSAPIRNHARAWLAAIGAKAVPLLIENLSDSNNDLQILSLNVLQEIGDESAASAIRKLINNQPPNPNIRFAAFEALAELSNRKGDYVLAGGIADPDSNVRLAAAKAIDRNLDATLITGVMNMVEEPGDDAEYIIKAVIDAQAGNLFLGLIKSAGFKKRACTYLGQDVHQDIREFFVKQLQDHNSTELANEILRLAQQQKKQVKGRVCAVDDSKVVLHIYRSVITELGYDVVLFSEPLKAISWLQSEKPDFLCTDLNMPGVTGIELIQEVRKKYNKDELPIILVTTQNEVRDNKAAREAGASEIMYKPFDTDMMSTVFEKIKGGKTTKS
ncbi:MAG: response regulator [Deltaproteobacteria bacterium]|nr:response regulator [Deltaproteobacteria bacterium]MBT4265869.1 response regulator [Deltaproteobacteria bacterium]MBT7152133.1 response regulator [Deltaproteobacteria bacterium]